MSPIKVHLSGNSSSPFFTVGEPRFGAHGLVSHTHLTENRWFHRVREDTRGPYRNSYPPPPFPSSSPKARQRTCDVSSVVCVHGRTSARLPHIP